MTDAIDQVDRPAPVATKPKLRIFLCAPRGFCAGVVRAIDAVEQALRLYGAPVYVRHEIVHNKYVVEGLKAKGAIFVEELSEVPDTDQPVIFSAHGVPKSIPAEAQRRNFHAIDATCPLVTKVHREAQIHFKRGRQILLVGHAGHPEVVGTLGQLPQGSIILVQTPEDIATLSVRDEANLAYVTQTTLSLDDTKQMVDKLHERFPLIVGPQREDICYATTNRQEAVKRIAPDRRRADRGGLVEFVELATPQGSRRALGLPDLPPRAARRGCRVGAVQGHQDARYHGRGVRAGSAGRGDHGRLRRALRSRGRDRVDGRRERVLPAAARAAAGGVEFCGASRVIASSSEATQGRVSNVS